MTADIDAMVTAERTLRWLSVLAQRHGDIAAAREALRVARRVAEALRAPTGCPGCSRPVEPVMVGRPRRWCEACHPPRRRAE